LDCRPRGARVNRVSCDRRLEQQQQYGEQHVTGCDEPTDDDRQRTITHEPAGHDWLGLDVTATIDAGAVAAQLTVSRR
jgi:hypothetical protein